MKKAVLILILFVFIFPKAYAQKDLLLQKTESVLNGLKCRTGIAVLHAESMDTFTYNGFDRFPMQSVFKFPLAMAMLDKVDRGIFSLDEKIYFAEKDLIPGTWSPVREKYPSGDIELKLSEVLSYTVSQSDNNGCDMLFRLLGGPKNVNDYIHSLGVTGINITANEEEMHRDWNVQFTNWCEPYSMVLILDIVLNERALSESSNDFLIKILTETLTGPKRIKGLLPEGTKVAHKTGSSGSNNKGITSATNDAGIVTLPDGSHLIIVVFVTDSKENNEVNERIIAEVTKIFWDYYTK